MIWLLARKEIEVKRISRFSVTVYNSWLVRAIVIELAKKAMG